MQEAVIVAATRTAVGKAPRGALADTRPDDMAAAVVKGLLARTGDLDPALVDDLILGCAFPEGEQGMNLARQVALLAGLPDSTSAMTLNRFCSSGLEAIHVAALKVMSGTARCIVAGGAESMSLVPMGGNKFSANPTLARERPGAYLNMGLTAERLAERYAVSREDQDAFSFESHRRAVAAQDGGRFKEGITPLTVERARPSGKGAAVSVEAVAFDRDEGPRRDTSLEALAKLRPAFKEGGTVTAGNSSQTSDGAAAVLVCDRAFAKERGLRPLVRYVAYATAGLAPEVMGLGPVHAVPKALDIAGLRLEDIDVIELNEAFASQLLYCQRELGLDNDKLNPLGGSISIGHPFGMTGSRMTGQLLRELKRQGKRYGVVTMCIGGGQGLASLFEAA
jgi:acetyl-CoA acyltransferase